MALASRPSGSFIRHVAEFNADVAGESDGQRDALRALFVSSGVSSNDVNLLDQVYGAFESTNEHYKYQSPVKLDDLYQNPPPAPRDFKFHHLNIPYLATVYVYDGPDHSYLTIKLPNDGFSYMRRDGPLFRHNREGWSALVTKDTLTYFPAMARAVAPFVTHGKAFYNSSASQLDFKFVPKEAGALGVQITFEPGLRYDDDSVPWS